MQASVQEESGGLLSTGMGWGAGLAAPWLLARANFEPSAPVLVSGTP